VALVKEKKPTRVGGSMAIFFPPSWTTVRGRKVEVVLDRIALVIPEGLDIDEVRSDINKLLHELEKFRASRSE